MRIGGQFLGGIRSIPSPCSLNFWAKSLDS